MALRKILKYPQHKEQLQRVSEPAPKINENVKIIIRDLIDTLRTSDDGIGLAASQIKYHKRVIIVRTSMQSNGEWKAGSPTATITPRMTEEKNEKKGFDGCISFPGLYGETIRSYYLKIKWIDRKGKSQDDVFEGFNAVLIHH
jgi:peptide deformylase